MAGGRRSGTVAEFDPATGWGIVEADGGEWPMHSTAIADGSRRIQPGTAVSFAAVPGRAGVFEATDVRPA